MKIIQIFLLLTTLPSLLAAQTKTYVSNDPAYIRNVDAADEQFEAGNFSEAIPFYQNALQVSDASFRTKYRLATCLLKSREFATANAWLQKCAEQNPTDFCELVLDEKSELYPFRPFIQWLPLQTTCTDALPQFNYPLKKELEEIRHFDQFIRSEHRLPTEADCAGTVHYKSGMSFLEVDSTNEERVKKIIAVHGYPGPEMVGTQQGNTVWLVLQHAPIEMQEQYFPLVENAMQAGQLSKGNWAYLVDRMHMNRGEKQIYGSQMRLSQDKMTYELYPLEDPLNVNKRRAEVGLGAIEDYISMWGVKFEPEEELKKQ